ncbi:hypothetical protein JCM10450v2_005747 [Rhodotorula kratochvilovae]
MSASPAPSLPPASAALLAQTTTHERVLLAQAVFEKGTGDFEAVGRLLRGHALLRARGEEWFTAENLAQTFAVLLQNVGVDGATHFPPQSPEVRKIAHKYYMDRVHELYRGMEECGDQFRITYSEIQELKDGKLDWRLTHPERAVPPSPAPGTATLP